MPRRKRLTKRKEEIQGVALINLSVLLGVGAMFSERDARRLACEWAEHRERILGMFPPTVPERHWAVEVLDRGNPPPHEPDPRLEMLPEDEALEWDRRQREEELRLAEVASQEYQRLREER